MTQGGRVRDTQDMTEPAETATRRWPWIAAAVSGGAVLATLLALLLHRGPTAAPITGVDAPPGTFTLRGTLTLTGGPQSVAFADGFAVVDPGELCFGRGGYNDIGAGTPVTVYDEAGTVVAHGVLGVGEAVRLGVCAFGFAVDVPVGSTFYQVEVSHRGRTTVEARADVVELVLG